LFFYVEILKNDVEVLRKGFVVNYRQNVHFFDVSFCFINLLISLFSIFKCDFFVKKSTIFTPDLPLFLLGFVCFFWNSYTFFFK